VHAQCLWPEFSSWCSVDPALFDRAFFVCYGYGEGLMAMVKEGILWL